MEDESPTRYMLSEGSVCLPKQEKEKDAMIDYSYNPYSPPKHPAVGQKRKRALKKEEVEKKPKATKIKQESVTSDMRKHRDPVLLPCASERYFTKERDQHSVWPLGILQVPRPKLFWTWTM